VPPTDPSAALEARLAELEAEIARLNEERERVAAALQTLTGRKQCANMAAMQPIARLAHSRSRAKPDDQLAVVANAAGLTLRSLAAKVGCSAPLITQARSGDRSISMELAQRIQAETRSPKYPEGYAATAANWRRLRSE
jgi:hypothetical protein